MQKEYASGYSGNRNEGIDAIIADVEGQLKILDSIFNCGMEFDADWIVRANEVSPYWVEKFFVTFSWYSIAQTYNDAIQILFQEIETARNGNFYNHLDINGKRFALSTKSAELIRSLKTQQNVMGSKNTVIPAQFGSRYAGRTAREAYGVLEKSEFGLNTFVTMVMLLTTYNRLWNVEDPWIYCTGETILTSAPDGDRLALVPSFRFQKDKLRFDAYQDKSDSRYFGSVTGFVPSI